MTRRSDQLDRIEASVARLEEALAAHASVLRDQLAAVRVDASAARQSSEATHAGVQALADMIPYQAPEPPSSVPQAAGGRTAGEAAPAARRAPTQPRERMLDG